MAVFRYPMRGVRRSGGHPFAIWRASVKGYRDGFQRRPAKLADGMLDSEYIRASLAHCEQDLAANWAECMAEASMLRSGVAAREREIASLAARVEELRAREESIRGAEERSCFRVGEEGLDEQLIHSRRKAEALRETGPLRSAREKAEERIAQASQEACAMRHRILDAENETALRCEYLVSECNEVLAHYVRAALRAMRNPIDPPWTLPRVRLDAQRLYESRCQGHVREGGDPIAQPDRRGGATGSPAEAKGGAPAEAEVGAVADMGVSGDRKETGR